VRRRNVRQGYIIFITKKKEKRKEKKKEEKKERKC
jgi:hypothetical protein